MYNRCLCFCLRNSVCASVSESPCRRWQTSTAVLTVYKFRCELCRAVQKIKMSWIKAVWCQKKVDPKGVPVRKRKKEQLKGTDKARSILQEKLTKKNILIQNKKLVVYSFNISFSHVSFLGVDMGQKKKKKSHRRGVQLWNGC